jgi:hypothetical protein
MSYREQQDFWCGANRVVLRENKCVDTNMIQVTTPWKDEMTKGIFDICYFVYMFFLTQVLRMNRIGGYNVTILNYLSHY